jgi:putative ABC transport system substrate-binding protein
MGELGYVEDRNLAIDYRFAEGRTDRLPELAAELIGLRVDVIIALGPAAVEAAKARTATVPIVASDLESDPVAAGFVASLARPGGNITGTFLDQAEISGKWLELLKTAIPKLSRVAVLWDSTTPSHQLKALKMGAPALAVTLQTLAVRGPEDFQGAFTAAARQHAQGVVMLSSPSVLRSGARLADLAATRRLPTISMFRQNAVAGCLMSYGPSLTDRYRRIGSFAARILKGARPTDLPIERPVTFELVINLKTAKALGLTIPPSLLARADQIID